MVPPAYLFGRVGHLRPPRHLTPLQLEAVEVLDSGRELYGRRGRNGAGGVVGRYHHSPASRHCRDVPPLQNASAMHDVRHRNVHDAPFAQRCEPRYPEQQLTTGEALGDGRLDPGVGRRVGRVGRLLVPVERRRIEPPCDFDGALIVEIPVAIDPDRHVLTDRIPYRKHAVDAEIGGADTGYRCLPG